MINELSVIYDFAFEIILVVVLATGGSVFAYFVNLKRCVRKHKEETNKEIEIMRGGDIDENTQTKKTPKACG